MEAVLKAECVEIFGRLPVGVHLVPRFKSDGTYRFSYVYGVSEPKTGGKNKYVTYQLVQYNGSGRAPNLISNTDILNLLAANNSNVKLNKTWRSEAYNILDECGFLIVAGVHNHGGGGQGHGEWITLRPSVGETCWHLNLHNPGETNSKQETIRINGTPYLLTGGTYGVGTCGATINLSYLRGLREADPDA